MADDDGSLPITQETVDAFTEKLLAWGEDLPVEERAVLLMLLNRANAEVDDEDDVVGFDMNVGLGLSPSQAAVAKLPYGQGTFEGWSKGPSWLRTWSQARPT
jgi:hypothetical protein